jgi:hypothetical protein
MSLVGTAVLLDLRLALEALTDLASTLEDAAGATVLLHRHLGLHGGRVEGRLMLDTFVHGNGGVDNGTLNHLAFDDGLNPLMHMMVDVLSLYGNGLHVAASSGEDGAGRLELLSLFKSQQFRCRLFEGNKKADGPQPPTSA